MKLQNLGDIHKIYISSKIFPFHRDTKYILEHSFEFGSFFVHTILTQENQSIKIASKYCISTQGQQFCYFRK